MGSFIELASPTSLTSNVQVHIVQRCCNGLSGALFSCGDCHKHAHTHSVCLIISTAHELGPGLIGIDINLLVGYL